MPSLPSLSPISLLLLPLGVATCGARDGVTARRYCDEPGLVSACEDPCGAGSRECLDGVWTSCKVETRSRECENECGTGVELCRGGAWGSCRVERVEEECSSLCGEGLRVCDNGVWLPCTAPQPKPPVLESIIRDFNDTHPDFETAQPGIDPGIVLPGLGPEDKPVYAGQANNPSTSGFRNFNQWYRDVPGVNLSRPLDLQLTQAPEEPGLFRFDGPGFFPIDGELLGNQGRPHNYHFTLEIATRFVYKGGETFSFTGDDDMWVFINRHLAIDLGGLHGPLSDQVSLDEHAEEFGLTLGAGHPLHMFFAERHVVQSNFSILTTLADVGSCR